MTTKQILGIKFFSGSPAEAVEAGARGGLVVVPSAPVLVRIAEDKALRAAVLAADMAITDSGLMVLMWWLLTREKLERVSGLEYLKLLLEKLKKQTADGGCQTSAPLPAAAGPVFVPRTPSVAAARSAMADSDDGLTGKVFWIMPTTAARDRNLAWLRSQGFSTTVEDCYIAPVYPPDGPLSDGQLLTAIRQRRPAHIIIALGGGVQERLGFALQRSLSTEDGGQWTVDNGDCGPSTGDHLQRYKPGIHCIGAAIGFLSGEQVRIPMWVDYLYLGWLWRSVSSPRKFVPRYWKAWRLVGLMIRYREKAPGMEPRAKSY